jgi:hypothetical protein
MTRFIFIAVALVGSLFASPVLAQEATSTENGSSTQTVETIPPVDAASNEALSDSPTVENVATRQSSTTPEPDAIPQAGVTVKRADQTSILRQGESAIIEPGIWHDWWNASDRDARVRVEVTPGERFAPKHYLASRGLGIPTLRVCRICCSSR